MALCLCVRVFITCGLLLRSQGCKPWLCWLFISYLNVFSSRLTTTTKLCILVIHSKWGFLRFFPWTSGVTCLFMSNFIHRWAKATTSAAATTASNITEERLCICIMWLLCELHTKSRPTFVETIATYPIPLLALHEKPPLGSQYFVAMHSSALLVHFLYYLVLRYISACFWLCISIPPIEEHNIQCSVISPALPFLVLWVKYWQELLLFKEKAHCRTAAAALQLFWEIKKYPE